MASFWRGFVGAVAAAAALFTGAVSASADPTAPNEEGQSDRAMPDQARAALEEQWAIRRANAARLGTDIAGAEGVVTAFVKFTGQFAAEARKAGQPQQAARTAARAAAQRLVPTEETEAGVAALRSGKSKAVLRRLVTSAVVPGMTVVGDAEQVRALARNPQVAGVYQVATMRRSNAGAVGQIGAVEAWKAHQAEGQVLPAATGAGVRVGVIDTGLAPASVAGPQRGVGPDRHHRWGIVKVGVFHICRTHGIMAG